MTGVAQAEPTSAGGGVTSHAALSGLAADDHLQYALLAGRALGQTLIGGTAAGEILALQGSSAANRGRIEARGGLDVPWDWTSDAITSGGIRFANVVPLSGGIINASVFLQNDVIVNNGLFIQSALDDASSLRWIVAPGFAVTTLFFARQLYRSTTFGVAPAQAFIYAAQCSYDVQGSGAVTVGNYRGLSYAPILRARNAGDNLTITNVNGVTVSPLWNTNNATAIVDFGTIRGVHMLNPAQVLFGQSLGTERGANIIGLDMANQTLSVTGVRAAVRSSLTNVVGTNYLLLNLGGAISEFGTGGAHFGDNTPVQYGGAAFNSQDLSILWSTASSALQWFFASFSDSLLWSGPAADAFLLTSNAPTLNELRLDFARIGFGSSGSVGNQAFNFAQKARTVTVAGGYASALFTAAGNLNLGVLNMSDVTAWVVNALSFDNSAYTITELATFKVGGMTISNPGGTVTERAAFWSTGRFMQRGAVQYSPIVPAALGAGNVNDWGGLLTGSPNNGTRRWARISGNAVTSVLTGIDATAVQDGDTHELTNVSANSIDITNQDAASVAANRIITGTGATFALGADRTVTIRYDSTTARWRLLERT